MQVLFCCPDNSLIQGNQISMQPSKRAPRFLLLMPDDVRMALEREAVVHARTLTAEINLRLRESLKAKAYPATMAKPPLTTDGTTPPAQAQYQPPNAKGPANLSETDQAMLDIFRRMPAQKQLALLSLFDN